MKQLTPSSLVPPASAAARLAGCHSTGCHSFDSDKTLTGRSLQGFFKKAQLPDGAPATDGYVQSKIARGGSVMPAFGNSLDAQQMRDLLAYLHTV